MFGDVEAGDVGAFTVGAVAWPTEQLLMLVLLIVMEKPLSLVPLPFEQSLLAKSGAFGDVGALVARSFLFISAILSVCAGWYIGRRWRC